MIKKLQRNVWLLPLLGLLISSSSKSNKKEKNENNQKKVDIAIRKLILDALKPREISIIELSKTLCNVEGVLDVNITVTEVDARTETVKITILGNNIDFEKISKVVESCGVVIRSIDEVGVHKEVLRK